MIFQEPTTSLNPCFTIGFSSPRPCASTRAWIGGLRAGAPSNSSSRSASRPRAAPRVLPAPALRRHEPARHDRDGDRLQSAPSDRRRADDRARRHHPGADPRSLADPAERARHGAVLITHNMGVVAETARARDGHVCRADHGGAQRRGPLRRAAAPLHGGPPVGAAGAQRRRTPRHDPGRGARPLRPAARLPVQRRAAPTPRSTPAPSGRA